MVGKLSTPNIEQLLLDLKNSGAGGRQSAACLLADIKDKSTVPALIEALKDTDYKVRMRAAEALGNIGDSSAIHPLVALLGDSNSSVWVTSAKAIVKIDYENKVDLVIEMLNDEKNYDGAAYTLGELKDKKAVEPLLKIANHISDGVRSEVIRALGKIGDAKAVDTLCYFVLSDKLSLTLKNDSIRALGQIAESNNLQNTCAVESLIKILKNTYSYPWQIDPRSGAVDALGIIKDKRATEPLVEMMNGGHISGNIIQIGSMALCSIQDRRAIFAMMLGYGTMNYDEREKFIHCLSDWATKNDLLEILLKDGPDQIGGKYIDIDYQKEGIKQNLFLIYLTLTDDYQQLVHELKKLLIEADEFGKLNHHNSKIPQYPQYNRIREIGMKLNNLGGNLAITLFENWGKNPWGHDSLMKAAYYFIQNDKSIPVMSKIWWNGIGCWDSVIW